MTAYAIVFDFPECEPVFALRREGEPFGFTPSLEQATRFDNAYVAGRILANSFGEHTSPWGTVVEVKA